LRKVCKGQLSQNFSFFHCRDVEAVAGVDKKKFYRKLAADSRCDFTDIRLSAVIFMDSYSTSYCNIIVSVINTYDRNVKTIRAAAAVYSQDLSTRL
jgi:hypothetical protein